VAHEAGSEGHEAGVGAGTDVVELERVLAGVLEDGAEALGIGVVPLQPAEEEPCSAK
jgi:hypothetical protein